MFSIRIIGAGSIGNHLANAARSRGWQVTLTDNDPAALERARSDIYPSRYGAWDDAIMLKDSRESLGDTADVVFIGTPPDSHIAVANAVLDAAKPRLVVLEKPVCGPGLEGADALHKRLQSMGVIGTVGYNHVVGRNTVLAEAALKDGGLGAIETISARTREHWGGIFKAHPWLAGPQASYLGFSARGGGAAGEHSHAINIWQHFAHLTGAGRVVEVSATLDMVEENGCNYDRLCLASLQTEGGLVGDVIQDVVTAPTEKSARIQGRDGYLEWFVNYQPNTDAIIVGQGGAAGEPQLIAKTRADDFKAEIAHLEDVLSDRIPSSPLALERGLDTQMVIAAIFKSHALGKRVRINWSAGYIPEAIG